MAQAEIDTPVWVNRSHPQPAQRPPTSEVGVVRWLRANLFSSVWNVILTLLTLLLVYYAGSSLLSWAFAQAFWEPIWINRKLFAVGTYPQARLLQPSLVLATVSLLFGLSAGRWGSIVRTVAVGLAALLLLLAIIPIGPAAQVWMGISLALLIAGYVMGLRVPIPNSVLAVAWVLSIPFALSLLRGSIELRALGLSIPILGGGDPIQSIRWADADDPFGGCGHRS